MMMMIQKREKKSGSKGWDEVWSVPWPEQIQYRRQTTGITDILKLFSHQAPISPCSSIPDSFSH